MLLTFSSQNVRSHVETDKNRHIEIGIKYTNRIRIILYLCIYRISRESQLHFCVYRDVPNERDRINQNFILLIQNYVAIKRTL